MMTAIAPPPPGVSSVLEDCYNYSRYIFNRTPLYCGWFDGLISREYQRKMPHGGAFDNFTQDATLHPSCYLPYSLRDNNAVNQYCSNTQ